MKSWRFKQRLQLVSHVFYCHSNIRPLGLVAHRVILQIRSVSTNFFHHHRAFLRPSSPPTWIRLGLIRRLLDPFVGTPDRCRSRLGLWRRDGTAGARTRHLTAGDGYRGRWQLAVVLDQLLGHPVVRHVLLELLVEHAGVRVRRRVVPRDLLLLLLHAEGSGCRRRRHLPVLMVVPRVREVLVHRGRGGILPPGGGYALLVTVHCRGVVIRNHVHGVRGTIKKQSGHSQFFFKQHSTHDTHRTYTLRLGDEDVRQVRIRLAPLSERRDDELVAPDELGSFIPEAWFGQWEPRSSIMAALTMSPMVFY